MRKYVLAALLFSVFLLFACAPASPEAELDKEFSLAVGQTITISGEDLKIKFVEVVEDSRCPIGATCIWAGRASCILEITSGGSSAKTVLTEPGSTSDNASEIYRNYRFQFHLTPYPELGKTISKGDYRMLLTVDKVNS